MPLVPWLPIAAIVACVWLMLNLTALTWIRFLIWMALGVVVYFALRPLVIRCVATRESADFGVQIFAD